MSEQKHTPGPWRVHGNTVIQDLGRRFDNWYTPQSHQIAVVSGNTLENRHLIAAAPDLLAAAQVVLAGLNARIDDAGYKCQPVPLFDGIAELHTAIQKAMGAEVK